MFFIWDDQNEAHIAKHGVEPHEAESVVRRAKRPFPRKMSDAKWIVRGRTMGRRAIQVIFVLRRSDDVDVRLLTASEVSALAAGESAVYVIHSRELRRGETL